MRNIEVVKKFYKKEDAHSGNWNLFTRHNGDKFELVNYKTVIAYIYKGVVHINLSKYSSTTSAIQTLILDTGVDYNDKYDFRLYKEEY